MLNYVSALSIENSSGSIFKCLVLHLGEGVEDLCASLCILHRGQSVVCYMATGLPTREGKGNCDGDSKAL